MFLDVSDVHSQVREPFEPKFSPWGFSESLPKSRVGVQLEDKRPLHSALLSQNKNFRLMMKQRLGIRSPEWID